MAEVGSKDAAWTGMADSKGFSSPESRAAHGERPYTQFGARRAVIKGQGAVMILTQDETVMLGSRAVSSKNEYRVQKGDFVAVVQPHEDRFSFSIRDTCRERPTIYGYGVDFPQAVAAVTELLDALTGHQPTA